MTLGQTMRYCRIIAGLKSPSIAQAFLRKYITHGTCFKNSRNNHNCFSMSGPTTCIAQRGLLLGNETEKQWAVLKTQGSVHQKEVRQFPGRFKVYKRSKQKSHPAAFLLTAFKLIHYALNLTLITYKFMQEC